MNQPERYLLNGDEAVAMAALDAGVALGTGYPGTPSTEILEAFSEFGGNARWSPNEKVALEVGIGVAFGGARALVTMKHVGLNVAADPLFTAAYTGVVGALVVVSADDPGMSSSQNEQDNRRYAVAAGVPMLEPSDSQGAYDLTIRAIEISERWRIPVMLRLTTRICHSKTIVARRLPAGPGRVPKFERDIQGRVMIPSNARPAHRRLRQKLSEIDAWNETSDLHSVRNADRRLGIITSGVAYIHALESAPEASFLKLEMTYPLPMEAIRRFASSVERCVAIEEGDPYLVDAVRAAGTRIEGKPEMYRFGELNVDRVRRILAGDTSAEPAPPRGKPPALCNACPHRVAFAVLGRLNCIVAGDIGCYTLGVLPPFEAMDTCVCMGASIGVGLGLRHVLPPEEARRVVSVIGDSTFVHGGITGLVEMVYNPPKTGHVVLILDNGTTAMTGLQEHPGTGRTLDHQGTGRVVMEDLARALGIASVYVTDPAGDAAGFEKLLSDCLAREELAVIVARRPCLLAAGKIKQYEKELADPANACDCESGTCSYTTVGDPGAPINTKHRAGRHGESRRRPEALDPRRGRMPGQSRLAASRVSRESRGSLMSHDRARSFGMSDRITNIVFAGLGGQGVLKASDVLAQVAFDHGLDVKKSEIHGMAQRGGSVTSDVRFGRQVLSPMVPAGQADYVVVLAPEEVESSRRHLREGGVLIPPDAVPMERLPHARSLNVALLGVLSAYMSFSVDEWTAAIKANLRARLHEVNLKAFELGRQAAARSEEGNGEN